MVKKEVTKREPRRVSEGKGSAAIAPPAGDSPFRLESDYVPRGDQPRAIAELIDGLGRGRKDQVLLGVTGSGKTYTVAKVIEAAGRPALVLSHNKTLAAQLYRELKGFFPGNAVEYFVSYYDYYQPEAYIPQSDTYIEKESSINDEIDKLRLAATAALFDRRDVIIVSSVSCIYGLGSPEAFYGMLAKLEVGDATGPDRLLRKLVEMQYSRVPYDLDRGTFRVRGDTVEIQPAWEDLAVRVEYFGDEIERLSRFDPVTGRALESIERLLLFPKTHYVTPREKLLEAMVSIRDELGERLEALRGEGKLLEAQRLEQRTNFDLEMIEQVGHCHGIENYSRHLTGRAAGEPPPTLLDYFPRDFLLVVDECHQTLPQVRAMYRGDRSRKETLVAHGFRLPSALDNRPLTFEEFDGRIGQTIHVSATPAPFELGRAGGEIVEQVIRPTGLLDPPIEVRPVKGQVDDLLGMARERAAKGERVLVTTLTKRMAEELTTYFLELGVRARYLHSDIETLPRIQLLDDLRRGEFDVLVGINLLREGLDLPEVSLVAVLDADKEGFLRSETSLIQISGRAARNVDGRVIFYADRRTDAIEKTLAETARRRKIQQAYNEENGIVPATVVRNVDDPLLRVAESDYSTPRKGRSRPSAMLRDVPDADRLDEGALHERIAALERQMREAAKSLEFEEAARLRDEIRELRQIQIFR
jgi:excinuclease ABC subunit B